MRHAQHSFARSIVAGGFLLATGCSQPELDQDGDGFTELTNDCDDTNPNVHPDAPEICWNGIDDNCNGELDELGSTSGRVWYLDADGDGYGSDTLTVEACEQPAGYAAERWDCDEGDPSTHPGAEEVCDGVDNDCDGTADEPTATDAQDWYPDRDGDGFGDDTQGIHVCTPPSGYILTPGDCLDSDPLVHPAVQEDCRTPGDDDCDGTPNGAEQEPYACVDYYADLDLDGFTGTAACLCEPDAVYTDTTPSDCDDTDPTRYPGAPSTRRWGPEDCETTAEIPWDSGAYNLSAMLHNGHGAIDARDIDGDGDTEVLYLASQAQIYDGPIEVGTAPRAASVPADTKPYRGGFVPDLDGDGADDVLVAPASDSSMVPGMYAFSSAEDATADLGDALFWSSSRLAWHSHRPPFAAEDLDGDGYAELFFAEPVEDTFSEQLAFIVLDPDGNLGSDHWDTQLLNIEGPTLYSTPSPYLVDLNGDGRSELLAGLDTYDTTGRTATESNLGGRGAAVVYELTEDRVVLPQYFVHGRGELGMYGLSVVDVDGDGHADLVGSDGFDRLTEDGGQLVVFLGPVVAQGVYGDWDTVDNPDILVSGLSGEDLRMVDPVGDLDLDGRADLLFSNRHDRNRTQTVEDDDDEPFHTWYIPSLEPGHHRVDEVGRRVQPADHDGVVSLGDPDGDGGEELVVLRHVHDSTVHSSDATVDLLLIDGDLP